MHCFHQHLHNSTPEILILETEWFGLKIHPFTMFNMCYNTVKAFNDVFRRKTLRLISPMCIYFAFTFRELSHHPSLYTVSGLKQYNIHIWYKYGSYKKGRSTIRFSTQEYTDINIIKNLKKKWFKQIIVLCARFFFAFQKAIECSFS